MGRPSALARLRTFLEAPSPYDDEHELNDPEKQFELVEAEERAKTATHPSYATIPCFFKKPDPESAGGKWAAEAKKELVQRKSEKRWDTNIMCLLWKLLMANCEVELGGEKENGLMDYAIYDKVRTQLVKEWNEEAKDGNVVGIDPFLTSSSFFKLPKDDNGKLSITTFFNYMLKKVTLYDTRVELGFNENGDGYLTESDLENYFYDLIPTLPALSRLPEHFYPFYVCGAVRKFFFFLDTHKRGKIAIDTIMQSSVCHEWMELQNASEEEECLGNWFATTTAAKMYSHYVQLDVNRNGMLSKDEMYCYNDSSFTKFFMDRVFEVSQTYSGEMDYKKYIEFVLAVENPSSKPAFQFFWKILDIHNESFLTPFVIKMFYRDVQSKLSQNGIDPVRMEDVVTEIFDMINPEVPLTVTKKDLERVANRDTIISMLVDYKAFWRYDNRESLASQQQNQPVQSAPPPPPSTASYAAAADAINEALDLSL